MKQTITDTATKAAIAAIASESASTKDKIEMLIQMAHGFVRKTKTAQDLWNAIALYQEAENLCGEDYFLLKARAKVGRAGALQSIPQDTEELLLQAQVLYTEALPILQEFASSEEVAEAQMNYGLVLQSLVAFNMAKIEDSIQVYQAALRVFTWENYPQEYAILHNNIAIAYLSMSGGLQQQYLFEGLAVQTFEAALKHINIIDHPREYGMLQNNLGNALQYLPSSHPLDNLVRAIAAYDQALKVRNLQDTPIEYANTIANKANALLNLPDDLSKPETGNRQNFTQARNYYQQAWEIFTQYGQIEQAQVVAQVLAEL
ncbi:hypothetical protein [Fischerella sp. NIES-3754]|uniref:hypothetical protein n=1 Tax=Fischerella sp. NIES-3754 TaxID=1752063 RepID=UPI000722B022|nr:hypothetical protein [Fischerella sp. NIES-3754]BAU04761.1 hypothetical protein FIS3754_06500 [Fischerella sp. NIES-3754]BCX07008.1 MAG: hypothetical protein KatS3mg066_0867 [Fischerella sp.]